MTTTADLSNVTAEQRAQILREERDALIMAWQDGQLNSLIGAEKFLNSRINALGITTITGDTTE